MSSKQYGTSPAGDMRLSVDQAKSIAVRLLTAAGASPENAAVTAHYLVEADVHGVSSHGLSLVQTYARRLRLGHCAGDAVPEVVVDSDAVTVIDAHNGLGQVAAHRAAVAVAEGAKRSGVAVATIRRNSHVGRLGGFVEIIAGAGCTSLMMCNAAPTLAPPGGRERVLGNNPIAAAFPSADGPPRVVDLATSEAAVFRIRAAADRGESIPEHWALDRHGNPTTDPNEAFDRGGALRPFGGPKGFALAFIVEAFAGALTGAAIGHEVHRQDEPTPMGTGQMLLAIDPHQVGGEHMATRLDALVARLTHTARSEVASSVRIPGERSRALAAQNRQQGIEIHSVVWDRLHRTAEELGVTLELD